MRVLVCRARPEAEATARVLDGLGHQAILAPVLSVTPLAVTLATMQPDALVITSANALTALSDVQVKKLAPCPVYAVGQRSGEAARRRGFADVRIGTGDASSLPDLLSLTLRPGSRILYLAGRPRKPTFESLVTGRYALVVVETYEAREAALWDADILDALRAGQVDACLHYSRRSAELALAFAERGGVTDAVLRLRHVCLSDDVAVPLRSAGAGRQVAAAATPDEASLMAMLSRTP